MFFVHQLAKHFQPGLVLVSKISVKTSANTYSAGFYGLATLHVLNSGDPTNYPVEVSIIPRPVNYQMETVPAVFCIHDHGLSGGNYRLSFAISLLSNLFN